MYGQLYQIRIPPFTIIEAYHDSDVDYSKTPIKMYGEQKPNTNLLETIKRNLPPLGNMSPTPT